LSASVPRGASTGSPPFWGRSSPSVGDWSVESGEATVTIGGRVVDCAKGFCAPLIDPAGQCWTIVATRTIQGTVDPAFDAGGKTYASRFDYVSFTLVP
jgi:hypothetical protein